MTLLFYAADGGVGLGHLSRLLGIADSIHQLDPDIPIIFVTDSSDARLLDEYPFPYYQLPDYHSLITNPRWNKLPSQNTMKVWKEMIRTIIEVHKPSIVFHDTFLQRHLHQYAKQSGSQQVFILRKRTNMNTYLNQNRHILTDFSLIAIPHEREEIEPLNLHWLPPERLMFCGPLLRRTRSDIQLDEIRRVYGLTPDEPTVVITNGGGNGLADGEDDFISIALNALRLIEDQLPAFKVIAITGPLARYRMHWVSFKHAKLIVREFEPNMLNLFAAANLVIARGGYNTVLELKEANLPAICVAAQRFQESQAERIQQAANAANIYPAELTLESITQAIMDRLPLQPLELNRDELDLIRMNKTLLAECLVHLADKHGKADFKQRLAS